MRTHHISVFGVATMVAILIATGLATRLAEVALVSAVRLTSVGGGGLLTPANLVGADHRHVTYALVRLLLPGLLVQALLVKLVVSSYRGLRISYRRHGGRARPVRHRRARRSPSWLRTRLRPRRRCTR